VVKAALEQDPDAKKFIKVKGLMIEALEGVLSE
jgi:hypothetical protein